MRPGLTKRGCPVSGARRIPTGNLVSFFLSKAFFSEIPSHFLPGSTGFNLFRMRSQDTFGLASASARLLAVFQRAEFHRCASVGHTETGKDVDLGAEGLWLELWGVLFSKVLTHLPLMREAGVNSVLWCWCRALADFAPS